MNEKLAKALSFADPKYVAAAARRRKRPGIWIGVIAASYILLNFGAGAAQPPEDEIDFTLDRPFLFAITHSGAPCSWAW